MMSAELESKQENKYFQSIDSMKGIAQIGVVAVHAGAANLSGTLGRIGGLGARGVQMFFVISSFLLFFSLDSLKDINGKQILKWYARKFLRLMPLYYLFNFIALMKMYFNGSLKNLSLPNIICNFMFINGFNPFYIQSINLNWYIADLAIFIFAAPWIKKIITNSEKVLAGTLAVGVASLYVSQMLDSVWQTTYNTVKVAFCYIFSFWIEIPCLFLGLLLFYLVRSNIFTKLKSRKLLSVTLLLFVLYIFFKGIVIDCSFIGLSEVFIFGILSFILLFSQMISPLSIINLKPLQHLGRYSYGIYLSHALIVSEVHTLVDRYIHRTSIGILLTLIITLFVSFIISILCTKFIEHPLIQQIQVKTCIWEDEKYN